MRYARVIVEVEPAHLDRLFDYRIPDDAEHDVGVGSRVEVVFAGRRVLGLVADVTDETDVPPGRIRELRRVLGSHRWATAAEIEVFRWAGRRFAAPVADVVRHALPRRVVDVERRAAEAGWFPGGGQRPAAPVEAPDAAGWAPYGAAGRRLLDASDDGGGAYYWRPLPGEDLGGRLRELMARVLGGGRDVLLVLPEPVSTAADAVVDACGDLAVDLRGATSPRGAYRSWLAARCGQARVVVGERGAVFWPLGHLGLAVVLDEASPALKERRSPRHHAREVALERARRAGGVGLLVGTVPSAPAWRLLAERRLAAVVPAPDIERAAAPVVRVDDRSDPRSVGRLGSLALDALRDAVARGELGVVVAARRGEGRALVCSRCGLLVSCPRCGSSLAVGDGDGERTVLCEGCGWTAPAGGPACERCGSHEFAPLAAGAGRLGEELSRTFPETRVAVLEGYAQTAPAPPAIVVATRGSVLTDPPAAVGAVVLPDLEGQLRRPTLDAAEDALRVAMRAGAWLSRTRRSTAGEAAAPASGRAPDRPLVVQAREADHHAVQALVRWDPGGFWRAEVGRRAELRFPPVAHAVRLDAAGDSATVAGDLRDHLPDGDTVLGPRPLGGDRSGFLVKSDDRGPTLEALRGLREKWSRDGLDVRVDVDPVDVS